MMYYITGGHYTYNYNRTGSKKWRKKKQLVENLTREAVEITEYPDEYFFVYVQEYPTENIDVGGKTLKELRSQ